MLPIASMLSDHAMRRSLTGALTGDAPARHGAHPHVAEPEQPTPLRLRRFSEGMELTPVPSSRWRFGRFSDGQTDELTERRAA